MLGWIFRLIVRGGSGIAKSGGRTNTGTVTGTRSKDVKCEKCGINYVYVVTCKATGPLSNPAGMQHRTANHKLDVLLDNAVEPAPCPSCGWFQADMVSLIRGRHQRWMVTAGGIVLAASIIFLLSGIANLTDKGSSAGKVGISIGALMLIAAIGLIAGRAYLASIFDPNSLNLESQKTMGSTKALTLVEYERQRGDEQAQKLTRREQAKRNMASGYGLPQAEDELIKCPSCGYHQEKKNKKCESCKKVLKAV